MSVDKESGGTRFVLIISALLAMTGAFFGTKGYTGLAPERPVPDRGKASATDSETGGDGPSSHVWNDPFQSSILGAPAQSASVLTSFESADKTSKPTMRLLVCLLDGNEFPENIDDRRRTRVALHGAMMRMGLAPESAQTLKTVRYRKDCNNDLVLPYERFYRIQGEVAEWILCVYVKEQDLGSTPIGMLSQLRDWIIAAAPTGTKRPTKIDKALKVLGPTNSERALTFLDEATGQYSYQDSDGSAEITCYMTAATVSKGGLESWVSSTSRSCISWDDEQVFKYAVGNTRVCMERAPSDASLSSLLWKELEARGVLTDPKAPPAPGLGRRLREFFELPGFVKGLLPESVKDLLLPREQRVVLIAEQDSRYGRELEKAMRDWLPSKFSNTRPETYWFPRGLDGYTPQTEAGGAERGFLSSALNSTGKGAGSSNGLDPRASMGHATKAFGDSMLDYLERLRIDFEMNVGTGRAQKVAAVVILCNDVFDKVMILKALRPWFRNTWFLTTDLDAQFLQRDNINATHNLVVASSVDFSTVEISAPKNSDASSSPDRFRQFPFRSASQMSAYQGVLHLLKPVDYSKPTVPRVYEIGLNGPIPIDRNMPELKRYMGWIWLAFVSIFLVMFFPYPSNPFRNVIYTLKSVIVKYALGTTAERYSKRLRDHPNLGLPEWALRTVAVVEKAEKDLKSHTAPFFMAQFQLVVAYCLGIAVCGWVFQKCKGLAEKLGEEHFYWNVGVSVWPTEIFRAGLIMLCLYWYARIVFRQALRIEEIEHDFPDLAVAPKALSWTPYSAFKRVCKELLTLVWGNWRFERKTNTLECWHEYKQATGVFPTLLRCVILTYLMTLFQMGVLAVAFGDRHVPVRGVNTIQFDKTMTFLLVIGLSLVASVVIDCAMMSYHAMNAFANKRSDWSETLKTRYSGLKDSIPCDKLLDLVVIGRISDIVLRHSYFLYILLLGTMLSRVFFFDNWNWSPFVIQFFASYFLMVLAAEYFLASRCSSIRAAAIEACEAEILCKPSERDKIMDYCKQITGMQTGAFRSFSENPVAKAVLVPLGGASAVGLLQYVALWTW